MSFNAVAVHIVYLMRV